VPNDRLQLHFASGGGRLVEKSSEQVACRIGRRRTAVDVVAGSVSHIRTRFIRVKSRRHLASSAQSVPPLLHRPK
jgi:hypothetical protein